MKNSIKSLCLATIFVATGFFSAQAQTLKVPAPSPTQTLKQAFALSEISIEYSRPSAKGRIVFGELVPFGKIWRTGANASTKITFGEEVSIQGNKLSAGTYALYTIPNANSWTIMIYKDLTLGGNVSGYDTKNEAFRFDVPVKKSADTVKTFTINVEDINPNKASVVMSWENTRVSFDVTANIDASIMSSIDKSINQDNRPYFQAASYYYENGKDLNMALGWVNKAVEQNKQAFWIMMLKARIENKLNDTTAAIASANKVIELASAAKNDDYVKMANDLISGIRNPQPAKPTEAVNPKKKKK